MQFLSLGSFLSFPICSLPIRTSKACFIKPPLLGPNTQSSSYQWTPPSHYVLTPGLVCPSATEPFLEAQTTIIHPNWISWWAGVNLPAWLSWGINCGMFSFNFDAPWSHQLLSSIRKRLSWLPAIINSLHLGMFFIFHHTFSAVCLPILFTTSTLYGALGYLNYSRGISDNTLMNFLAMFQSNEKLHQCPQTSSHMLRSTWHKLGLTL